MGAVEQLYTSTTAKSGTIAIHSTHLESRSRDGSRRVARLAQRFRSSARPTRYIDTSKLLHDARATSVFGMDLVSQFPKFCLLATATTAPATVWANGVLAAEKQPIARDDAQIPISLVIGCID